MQASQGVVYSYLRFSDPRQAAGNSADRQAEYAKSWAAARGFTLDESLSLRDEGLSAFHQRHIKQGALGVFLQAVDEGRIPAGSVLVVEGLDRLSRAEPMATSDLRLSVLVDSGAFATPGCDGGMREAASTGGVVHGAVRAQLDSAHAQRIIDITDAGDRGLIALKACQGYIQQIMR